MKAFRYIAGVVAVMGLASCQNDDLDLVGYNSDPNAVRITAAVGHTLTRSNPTEEIGSEKATQFKAGDRISVSTEDQSAVIYVLEADNSWKPVDPDVYLVWNKSIHTFTAHYPAGEYTGYEPTRVIQDSEDDIAKADYMSFSGKFSDTGSISFEMERRTARVVIDEAQFSWGNQYIEGTNAIYEVKEIKIHAGDASGISPYKVGTRYYALVNPGAEKAYVPFITLRVGPKQGYNGTEEELVIRGIPELAANYSYTFHLTIGKNKAELGKVEVEDWSASENIWGGTASDGYVAYTAFNGGISYDIYTTDGFLEVNRIITASDATDAMLKGNITLYTDIVLPTPAPGESNWIPIGSSDTKPFKGNFYGNGKTITGMVVVDNPDKPYQGFFGCVGGGNVSDLTLIGCTVKGHGYIGGIAGYNSGCNITGCKVISRTDYPVLIESMGYDDIGTGGIGGIVGENILTISECSLICETGATITITDGNDEHGSIGGIAGESSTREAKISNCKVENNGGTINFSASYNGVGGVIGQNRTGSINDCSVTGVAISGDIYVGGFAGYNDGTITGTNMVTSCVINGRDGYVGLLLGYGDGANITDGGGNNVVYAN